MLFSYKSPHRIHRSPDSMKVKYILAHIEDEPFLLMVHIVCSGHKPTQIHDMRVPTNKLLLCICIYESFVFMKITFE